MPSSTGATEQRPFSEPLKLPDINIHRSRSESLAGVANVRESLSESVSSISVRSLTMQLQRGKEREALRARIAERSKNDNKLSMLDRKSLPRFTTSMTQPISNTSALLKARGGTKYRHDDRHRAEIYAINRLLRDHENGLYDEFIEAMKRREAEGLSTDFHVGGGRGAEGNTNYEDEDDDAKSDSSSIVPSPEQTRNGAGKIFAPSSPKVVVGKHGASASSENSDTNNKKTTMTPLKSKLSRMLNKEDFSFNAV